MKRLLALVVDGLARGATARPADAGITFRQPFYLLTVASAHRL